MKTQEEKIQVTVATPAADERPLFAPEFVKQMRETAYDTLKAHLEEIHARREAIELLDDLVLLMSFQVTPGRKVTWIENQGMAEALGALSHNVVALGGGTSLK